MKLAFTTFLFLLVTSLFCQLPVIFPRDNDGKIHFKDIITVDSIHKDELYIRARQFITVYWNSAKDVTQMDDKDAGIIITSGFTDIQFSIIGFSYVDHLYYTLKISVKDGKYMVEIYDLFLQAASSRENPNPLKRPAEQEFTESYFYKGNKGKPKDFMEEKRKRIQSIVDKTFKSLNKEMNKAVSNTDW